jgi:phosphoketolase
VPARNRFRRDDEERVLPAGPEATNAKPKDLVEHSKSRPRMSSPQQNELLQENEILEDEVAAMAKQAGERAEPEQNGVEHGRELQHAGLGRNAVSG